MKKTILILLVIILTIVSKPAFAETADSAEIVFEKINSIINKKRAFTTDVVDYSIEIIKKWPESRYAGEVIDAYRYSFFYTVAAQFKDEKVIIKNSRWFENHIVKDDTSEIETAEIIVYANMLIAPSYYTEYHTPIAFIKREDTTLIKNNKPNNNLTKNNKPYIEYDLDFVENESIKALKYIETHSINENYRVLAFFALLGHHCSTNEGLIYAKNFIEKHSNHPAMAKIRLYYADALLNQNRYDEGINEIKKVIELYNNILVPFNEYNYGIECYNKLSYLYFEKKDYENAKKYILLLKENAPSNYGNLDDLNRKLQYIEKLTKNNK